MMHNLIVAERPTEEAFHHQAMLSDLPLPKAGHVDISIQADIFTAFPIRRILSDLLGAATFARTILAKSLSDLMLKGHEWFAAILTNSRNIGLITVLSKVLCHLNVSNKMPRRVGGELATVTPSLPFGAIPRSIRLRQLAVRWIPMDTRAIQKENRRANRLCDCSNPIISRVVNWFAVAGGMAALHLWLEK